MKFTNASSKFELLLFSEKHDHEYRPSYDWGAPTLGDRHERIAEAVWHIPGWLMPEDALKLYELAYFTTRPILEIGMYCGRSTTILATAVADRGHQIPIISLDTDPFALSMTLRSLQMHGVEQHVLLSCSSVQSFVKTIPEFAPGLIFLDANHAEAAVRADIDSIRQCTRSGSLLLFHDYLPMVLPETEGFPVSAGPIEVKEAVSSSWIATDAKFAGTFGASALFQVA
ncbi:MAG TPA: class I SAM-dependent methyltransferase [Streptosporangiaceae bacterium]|jgi:predicted O-methyltransferase YrrM